MIGLELIQVLIAIYGAQRWIESDGILGMVFSVIVCVLSVCFGVLVSEFGVSL